MRGAPGKALLPGRVLPVPSRKTYLFLSDPLLDGNLRPVFWAFSGMKGSLGWGFVPDNRGFPGQRSVETGGHPGNGMFFGMKVWVDGGFGGAGGFVYFCGE